MKLKQNEDKLTCNTVRQGLYYLGGQKSNTDYLSALEHESHLKE